MEVGCRTVRSAGSYRVAVVVRHPDRTQMQRGTGARCGLPILAVAAARALVWPPSCRPRPHHGRLHRSRVLRRRHVLLPPPGRDHVRGAFRPYVATGRTGGVSPRRWCSVLRDLGSSPPQRRSFSLAPLEWRSEPIGHGLLILRSLRLSSTDRSTRPLGPSEAGIMEAMLSCLDVDRGARIHTSPVVGLWPWCGGFSTGTRPTRRGSRASPTAGRGLVKSCGTRRRATRFAWARSPHRLRPCDGPSVEEPRGPSGMMMTSCRNGRGAPARSRTVGRRTPRRAPGTPRRGVAPGAWS